MAISLVVIQTKTWIFITLVSWILSGDTRYSPLCRPLKKLRLTWLIAYNPFVMLMWKNDLFLGRMRLFPRHMSTMLRSPLRILVGIQLRRGQLRHFLLGACMDMRGQFCCSTGKTKTLTWKSLRDCQRPGATGTTSSTWRAVSTAFVPKPMKWTVQHWWKPFSMNAFRL